MFHAFGILLPPPCSRRRRRVRPLLLPPLQLPLQLRDVAAVVVVPDHQGVRQALGEEAGGQVHGCGVLVVVFFLFGGDFLNLLFVGGKGEIGQIRVRKTAGDF